MIKNVFTIKINFKKQKMYQIHDLFVCKILVYESSSALIPV